MKYIKKIGLLLSVLTLTIQSCVRNEMDTCPPAIRYALSFEYLLHTAVDANGRGIDLFPEDVDKMYVYVFDKATGICIYEDITLTGPFSDKYKLPLPLGEGTYNIIVWGMGVNRGNPLLNRITGIMPEINVDVTTIDQARFRLNELNNDVRGKIEKTFYGEIIDKSIPPFINEIDTVDLMNISKMVRVIIPDIEADPVTFPDWENNVQVTIEGDNGAYYFGVPAAGLSSPAVDPVAGRQRYFPYQTSHDDSLLVNDPIFTRGYENGDRVGLVVDISTLRLIVGDTNMKIVITWTKDSEVQRIEVPLLEIVTRNPAYAWSGNRQRDLDRDDRWEITFGVTDTYISVATGINQWHVIKQDVGVGGILQ